MSDCPLIASGTATAKISRWEGILTHVGYGFNFDRSALGRNLRSVPTADIACAVMDSNLDLSLRRIHLSRVVREAIVHDRSFEFIGLRVGARVAWLEFNRAPINAFNRQMVQEVRDAIGAALSDPEVRVLVLASAIPSYFSAGADLHEFKGMKGRGMRHWVSMCHEIARLLRWSPKPLLAAINGTAVGGGLEMALHCDLRFAASDARLGQPEIRIAFIPPIATTQALVRLLGRPKAIRYLYEGSLLTAAEALAWGLVDEVIAPGDLGRRIQDYAEDLAAKPAAALAAIRRTITLGGGMSFEDGMALELETTAALADTPDFAEGVDAFLNKRAPRWADN